MRLAETRTEDKIAGTMYDIMHQSRTLEKSLKAQTSGQHLSVMLPVLGILADVLSHKHHPQHQKQHKSYGGKFCDKISLENSSPNN